MIKRNDSSRCSERSFDVRSVPPAARQLSEEALYFVGINSSRTFKETHTRPLIPLVIPNCSRIKGTRPRSREVTDTTHSGGSLIQTNALLITPIDLASLKQVLATPSCGVVRAFRGVIMSSQIADEDHVN